MNSIFYRYIRPLKLNEQRLELETQPRGGVCLRFDRQGDVLTFTHARCHADELFSKKVAKHVADRRFFQQLSGALNMTPTIPLSLDTTRLAESVITACEQWNPVNPTPYLAYLKLELHELKNTLQLLISTNRRESEKADIWSAGIAAAKYGDRYESLSR